MVLPDAPVLLVASTPSRHPFSKGLGLQGEAQVMVVCHGSDQSTASAAI